MMLKQISVFIENKKGRLAELTKVISESGIDLVALSIADTTDFGILRCLVKDTDLALKAIKEAGFTAKTTEVLAVVVPDRPGGLSEVLEVLEKEGIQVEYLYSFVRSRAGSALILFRVEEIEKTIEIMNNNGIKIMPGEEIYDI